MSSPWPVVGFSLVLCGCGPSEAPPKLPPPVTVQLPPDNAPVVAGDQPSQGAALEGTWTHTLPAVDGAERRVVLKYVKDQDGPERFEITQHDWPDKPVFTEKVTNGKDTELRFKMVSPTEETQETAHTLTYFIHQEEDQWVGTLRESWNSIPQSVTLTKSD